MTREALARALAEKCGECGFIKGDLICTRPRDHEGEHRGTKLRKYIPIT